MPRLLLACPSLGSVVNMSIGDRIRYEELTSVSTVTLILFSELVSLTLFFSRM